MNDALKLVHISEQPVFTNELNNSTLDLADSETYLLPNLDQINLIYNFSTVFR